jgi:hypothetical protein
MKIKSQNKVGPQMLCYPAHRPLTKLGHHRNDDIVIDVEDVEEKDVEEEDADDDDVLESKDKV